LKLPTIFLAEGEFVFNLSFIIIGGLFLLGSFDDLFIDLIHLIFRLKPLVVSPRVWKRWRSMPERRLAIMIPAWQEASVLEPMVRTNLRRIRYQRYKWFIGVYPNDVETQAIAADLLKRYPDKVEVIVADRPGPTSKAHCLNCILKRIEESNYAPHFVAIHDAEDVIHPDAFTAINAHSTNREFIQLPIFSLPVPTTEWVSGTYLDEFAEIHLKEIPVRKTLGMPIPSAGVGTFFSYALLLRVRDHYGYIFDEGNLTEDYEISLRISRLGGRQDFLLLTDENGEMVATREYFPHELKRSIRQKTRWTTGIALQTMMKWKSFGVFSQGILKRKNLSTAYGLFRDRKSLWSNPTVVMAWALIPVEWAHSHDMKSAAILLHLNLTLFGVRMIQRARFCTILYGWKHGALSVPRVLLSNVINSAACIKAIFQFFQAPKSTPQRKIEWDKTDHRFPDLGAA
jgi:adsorption protein B